MDMNAPGNDVFSLKRQAKGALRSSMRQSLHVSDDSLGSMVSINLQGGTPCLIPTPVRRFVGIDGSLIYGQKSFAGSTEVQQYHPWLYFAGSQGMKE